MKEHPILFSGPMVRAVLDGSKTQTRRIVKPQPRIDEMGNFCWNGWNFGQSAAGVPHVQSLASSVPRSTTKRVICPYGAPSDRLWVRETFFAYGRWDTRFSAKKGRDEWHFTDMTRECDRVYQYAADHPDIPIATSRHGGVTPAWWKRPAIHMPRHVSRTNLNMAGVRIERLNGCSQEDAEAEGIRFLRDVPDADETLTPRQLFMCLWDSINEDRGLGWDTNPWVWVIEFKHLDKGPK